MLINKEKVEYYKYHFSTDITELIFGEDVKIIEEGAFSNCKNLKSIKFLNPNTKICANAFKFCDNLSEIILPEELEILPEGCFGYCTSLRKIVLPKSLKVIEEDAFKGCKKLEEILLPDSLGKIEQSAFFGCGLKHITFPKEIELSWCSFGSNVSLEEVYFKEKYIQGAYVFTNCNNLKKIILPNNISDKIPLSPDTQITSGIENKNNISFYLNKTKDEYAKNKLKQIAELAGIGVKDIIFRASIDELLNKKMSIKEINEYFKKV